MSLRYSRALLFPNTFSISMLLQAETREKCTFLQFLVLPLHSEFLSVIAMFSRLVNSKSVLPSDPTHTLLPRQTLSQISCSTFPRENTASCRRTVRSEQRYTFRDFHGDEWRVPWSSPLDSPYLVFTPFPFYLSAPQRLSLVPTISFSTLTRPKG